MRIPGGDDVVIDTTDGGVVADHEKNDGGTINRSRG